MILMGIFVFVVR